MKYWIKKPQPYIYIVRNMNKTNIPKNRYQKEFGKNKN